MADLTTGVAVLQVSDLTVHFGGATAVDSLSLVVPRGSIVGLIGPNGAGKTSTFNACSGLLKPTSGRIELDGVDVTKEPPHKRALRGMGRTFQRFELFDSLPVRTNVALGREARSAGVRPVRHVFRSAPEARSIRSAADDAIELCGLGALADRPAGGLSTGQRRLVELARVVAGGFHLLLLDEPSSGLDRLQTDVFAEILVTLVREKGIGILLVEHDMGLVMRICQRLFVLDFGRLIFEGDPEAARSSDTVRDAYLGSAA